MLDGPDIPMQKSLTRRDNSIMGQEPDPVDIWRIQWAWKAGNGSGSEVEMFSTYRRFENRLFSLLLDADGNQRGMPDSLKKSRYLDWFHKRQEPGPIAEEEQYRNRRVDRILHVEHLEDGEWVPYKYGISAPVLKIERQD